MPDPSVPADGVVIQVAASGLCLSDWHGWQGHDPDIGKFPHVPGHELAGTIEAVGEDVRCWEAGDRVTLPFVCGCGSCSLCAAGNPQVCPSQFQPGFSGWGAFAERVAIRYADYNLVALPDDMSFETAALLGCRVVTAYRAIRQQGRVAPGEWLAIFGCGGVGLSAVMFGKALGAQIVAVDINPKALARATELGAEHAIRSIEQAKVAAQIRELSGGGVQLSLDALGSPAILKTAIACLAPRGRHVQVGLLPQACGQAPLPMSRIIAEELEILGSHGIAAAAYPEVFALIAAGKIDLNRLLAGRLSLDDAAQALMRMPEKRTPGIHVVCPMDGGFNAHDKLEPGVQRV